mgnify:CR=1 FL=1
MPGKVPSGTVAQYTSPHRSTFSAAPKRVYSASSLSNHSVKRFEDCAGSNGAEQISFPARKVTSLDITRVAREVRARGRVSTHAGAFVSWRAITAANRARISLGRRFVDCARGSKGLRQAYLYQNWSGGRNRGGGYAHSTLLVPGGLGELAYARQPLVDRIPRLRVGRISAIYGEFDWMDHRNMKALKTSLLKRKAEAGLEAPARRLRTQRS